MRILFRSRIGDRQVSRRTGPTSPRRRIESTDGRRAAVEFWVRMLSGGADVTLIGILFLRFAGDGRCEELRETWLFEPGDHPPHEGWGT